MTDVKISVIMPVYNCAQFLVDSIESFLAQTLVESELICVDDGSTDGSSDILYDYEQRYPGRIRTIKQENLGAGPARNKGIDTARGEFIFFLDGDDTFPYQTTLDVLYGTAKRHNVPIAGGSIVHSQEAGDFSDFSRLPHFEGLEFRTAGHVTYRDYQFDFAYYRFIYDREFIQKNNLYFPNYLRYQDPPFFVKAMWAARTFYAIPDITYRLRIGHKKVAWTTGQVLGVLDGISDIARFAAEHKLERLFDLNLVRLIDHRPIFEESVFRGRNMDVLEALLGMKRRFLAIPSDFDIATKVAGMPTLVEAKFDDILARLEHLDVAYPQVCAENDALRSESDALRSENRALKRERYQILASTTWKTGSTITWLPRTLKRFLTRRRP